MHQSFRRAILPVLMAVPLITIGSAGLPAGAALLAPRPGPIDRPLSFAVADFDRDGIDDIVVAYYQAAVLNMLVGRADGTFAPHPLGPFGVGTATIGNPTTGPFQLIALDLAPDDVDSDTFRNEDDNCPNLLNLAEPDGTQLDANANGIGDACEVGENTDEDPEIEVPIDTDSDGIPDFDPDTLVLDNCPRRPNPGQEDTNGDGVGDACAGSPDLLILTASEGGGSPLGTLRVRMNSGDGGLVTRRSYSTSIAPGSIAVADYNGDGHVDVALTNTTFESMEVFPGLGDGLFSLPLFFDTGEGPQGMAWGDWDGDGDADLVVANRADDTISVFINAAGVLPTTATATQPTLDAPTVLLAGDLNGDAFTDLVVIGQGIGEVNQPSPASVDVRLGGPGGELPLSSTITLPGTGHGPRAGLLADLDGNGTLDLALADFPLKQVPILPGLGDGTFGPPAITVNLPAEPTDIAAIRIPPLAGPPDLAVLQFNTRIELLHNAGGLSFTAAATSPASPWKETRAMIFTGADLSSGGDLVLLQGTGPEGPRFDVLSGVGDNTFRPQGVTFLEELKDGTPPDARFLQVADVAFNNRPDLAIVDPTAGKLVLVSNLLTGVLAEQPAVPIPPGAEGISTGNLLSSIADYDRDGVPNRLDNCPTIYNPPGCPVGDSACKRTIACNNTSVSPVDCAATDPVTGQCDSDLNGIGDHCQILSETCVNIDPDFDLVAQYDLNALKTANGQQDFDADTVPNVVDNCPTVANSDQADSDANDVGDACQILDGSNQPIDPDADGIATFDPQDNQVDNCADVPNPLQEDNDGDRVGNACVIAKALDNCPSVINGEQGDVDGDGVGDACAAPPPDLMLPYPAAGEVVLLAGDGSGFLHEAGASPLSGLDGASAAVTGHLALNCFGGGLCQSHLASDIAVALKGAAAGSGDDGIALFVGNDTGSYTPQPLAPAAGDPAALLLQPDASACPDPDDPTYPTLRLDPDGRSDLLIVTEAGADQIRVLVGSNMNGIDAARSPLITPVGHPAPLPAPAGLRAVASLDLNADDIDDLVAVAGPSGGPTTLRVYIGLGGGLFFTDPSLDPAVLQDDLDLPVTGFIDLKTDSLYPDLALFSRIDQSPFSLFNILPERADIDGSGRIDGFDLVVLARAFGSERGEDFIIQADATLQQSGSGWGRTLVGSGIRPPGQDLAKAGGCGTVPVLMSGAYGLPVDLNLDGIVDGIDLAILASRFGLTLP